MSSEAEIVADLKRVAKLPENRRCANCDVDNSFGHGNVCMPFKTFVCSNCKSAHQAYSHRVKSISQSNWNSSEVESLKSRSGGGNEKCRQTWLSKCPNDLKPKEGDHPDRIKAFIVAAYEEKRYYSNDSNASTSSSSYSTMARTPSSSSSCVTNFTRHIGHSSRLSKFRKIQLEWNL